jgi:bile acid-coenzyme A ligase
MGLISVANCVRYWVDRAPHAPAVTDDLGTLSFSELDRVTNRLARAYRALGVERGSYVTIALPNGSEFIRAALATWKAGGIPHPIAYRTPAVERQAMLELVKPRLIVGWLAQDSGHAARGIPAGFVPPAELSDGPVEDVISPHWKAIASGGSTGRPKVIVARPAALFDPEVPYRSNTTGAVQLVAGPLYHNAPFLLAARGLFSGHHLVIMARFDAEQALARIQRFRIQHMMLVPTMMQRITRLPDTVRSRYDVSSLKSIIHCAAPCPAWLKRAWIDWLGPEVVQELYGGTEGCGATWISGQEWLQRPGSVGRAMAGYRIRVKDAAGEEARPGEIGDVYMMPDGGSGSSYFYLGAQSHRDADGWEWIGDMGHVDAEGYLFLADRRTDLILCGGANIYPAEVEAAIDAYPGVLASAVIGLPNEDLGAVAHAIVEPDRAIDEAALMEYLEERLVPYKLPRSIEFVSEPLRDEAGKVRRAALRAARLKVIA